MQTSIERHRDSDPAVEEDYRDALAGEFTWLAPAFGQEVPFANGARVVAAGDGFLMLLNESLRRDRALAVDSSPGRPRELDHKASDDLRLLCMHGSGLRTRLEMLELFELAGVDVTEEQVIGWGDTVVHLTARGER